jgi:hypothetical protein
VCVCMGVCVGGCGYVGVGGVWGCGVCGWLSVMRVCTPIVIKVFIAVIYGCF